MAFKYMVESNSDKPPDKNMMPAVSGGTLELSIFKVYSATSLALDFFGSRQLGNHGRLQEHAVELDVVVGQVLEGFRPHHGRNFKVAVDVVVAIQKNLRLNDRHQTSVLADGGVAGEAVGAVSHGNLGRTGRDGHDGAPLAEAGALLVVLGGALSEAVETLAPGLAAG